MMYMPRKCLGCGYESHEGDMIYFGGPDDDLPTRLARFAHPHCTLAIVVRLIGTDKVRDALIEWRDAVARFAAGDKTIPPPSRP